MLLPGAVQNGVQIRYHPASRFPLRRVWAPEVINAYEGKVMSHENLNGSENEPQESAPAPFVTPPTQAGPLARPAGYAPYAPPAPVWPTVIGVIGVVLGAGALLITLGSLGMSLVMMQSTTGTSTIPMPQFNDQWMPWTIVSTLLTCAAAILLLVAGIGIAKRLAWGPRLAKVWAVLKLVVVAAGVVIGFQMQREAMEAMSQSAGSSPVGNAETMVVGLMMCAGLVWGWALPVFLLIWFSRASVKEQVSKWS